VIEAALSHVDEEHADLDDVLPPRGRLPTRALVELAKVCLAHAAPLATRAQRAEYEHLSALVDRALAATPGAPREPWHRELYDARREHEHSRGALSIAAFAAEIAHAHLLRSAPGAGAEAAELTARATDRTAKLLARDPAALHAFARALCVRAGELIEP
jgi:hypothetical protein